METQTAHSSIDKSENDRMERKEATLGESIKKYVNGMYEEYKKCFELKNFERIEKIIKNITNVDPGSNILNIIEGSLSLYRGRGKQCIQAALRIHKELRFNRSLGTELHSNVEYDHWPAQRGAGTVCADPSGPVRQQISDRRDDLYRKDEKDAWLLRQVPRVLQETTAYPGRF